MREFVRLTRCIIVAIGLAIIGGLNCGEGSVKSFYAQAEERGRWTTVSDVVSPVQLLYLPLSLFPLDWQLDWLQQLNYSHELHNVSTADGYQLQLQRLPQVGARPVLLVHGLLSSSLGWVCLGVDRSLGKLGALWYGCWMIWLTAAQPFSCIDATTTCGWRICAGSHPTAGSTSS